jgi:hypothetical protein
MPSDKDIRPRRAVRFGGVYFLLARGPNDLVRLGWQMEEEPMSTTATIQELNRDLARRINVDARGNPQSPYANKFVGIANGQVVVVTDDLDDYVRQLNLVEPDPTKTFGIEASHDYDQVDEIWGLT